MTVLSSLAADAFRPSGGLPLHLINPDRSEHHLSATVLEGNVMVQQSPATRFDLQRIHH